MRTGKHRGTLAVLAILVAKRSGSRPMRGSKQTHEPSSCVILLACVVLAIGWPGGADAGDPAAGRHKAAACRTCHGLDGLSRQPDAPHIAGQVAVYLRDQLAKYRSGERAHPVMEVIAKQLSDTDIEDLAAYYASIKLSVEMPP